MSRQPEARELLATRFAKRLECPVSVDVAPGWLEMVADMLEEIAVAVAATGKRIALVRVFAKYASLRAEIEALEHASALDQTIDAIAGRYEELSAARCEQCGQPGAQREIAGWLYVACGQHKRLQSRETQRSKHDQD